MSEALVTLDRVSRWYGQVIGLNDVTCTVGPGVTALLGMNGAGKTTMIRMITGQIRETTGRVSVCGMEPFANPEVYKRLGYCPEIDNFYEHQTGRQFVIGMARLYGFSKEKARMRTQTLLEEVGMADRCDRKIAGYSKGMRQRIKLAQAMLHDPDIILLDEPLNGLDPVGRREFMDVLKTFASMGKTIIVSSHILFEVEQMTRSIILLHRGRLLATGDLSVIREVIDKYPHRIHIETPEPRRVAERVVGLPYVLSVQMDPRGAGLEIQTRQPNEFYDSVPSMILEEDIPITSFSSPDNNLESIFKYLVEY
ncbi:MAG TPA: ABC transporter ATP-binding protein [Fimbriimonas sp.]|nr:ABC transporter ATP-binding protein [Fimbriimonas sp.]